MLRYRVLLEGRNFRLEVNGASELLGFWTTRFVLARSPDQAARVALSLIQQDEIWADSIKLTGDPDPVVLVDEIDPVDTDEPWPRIQPGLVLYVAGPDDPPLM